LGWNSHQSGSLKRKRSSISIADTPAATALPSLRLEESTGVGVVMASSATLATTTTTTTLTVDDIDERPSQRQRREELVTLTGLFVVTHSLSYLPYRHYPYAITPYIMYHTHMYMHCGYMRRHGTHDMDNRYK
jgi:hypothetical protein